MNKKGRTKRKVLSLLLAVAMIVSLMPTVAFASNGNDTVPSGVGEDIIYLGSEGSGVTISFDYNIVKIDVPQNDGYTYLFNFMSEAAANEYYVPYYGSVDNYIRYENNRTNYEIQNATKLDLSDSDDLTTAMGPAFYATTGLYENPMEVDLAQQGYDTAIFSVYKLKADNVSPNSSNGMYAYAVYGVYCAKATLNGSLEALGPGEYPDPMPNPGEAPEGGETGGENGGTTDGEPTVPTKALSTIGVGELVPVGTVLSLEKDSNGNAEVVFLDDYKSYLWEMASNSKLVDEYSNICEYLGFGGYGAFHKFKPDESTGYTFEMSAEKENNKNKEEIYISTTDVWLCYLIYEDGSSSEKRYCFVSPDNLGGANTLLSFENAPSGLKQGDSVELTAGFNSSIKNPPSGAVVYELIGSYAAGTSVDPVTGVLTCAANESATKIRVHAKVIDEGLVYVTNIDIPVVTVINLTLNDAGLKTTTAKAYLFDEDDYIIDENGDPITFDSKSGVIFDEEAKGVSVCAYTSDDNKLPRGKGIVVKAAGATVGKVNWSEEGFYYCDVTGIYDDTEIIVTEEVIKTVVDDITVNIDWNKMPSLKVGNEVPELWASIVGTEPYVLASSNDLAITDYGYQWVKWSAEGEKWIFTSNDNEIGKITSTDKYAISVYIPLSENGGYIFAEKDDITVTSKSTAYVYEEKEVYADIILELGTLKEIQAAKKANTPSVDYPIYVPVTPPTITVPVTGEDNVVHVDAQISGSTATVLPIDQKEIDHVSDGTDKKTNIGIDLTGLAKVIDTAVIPKETLEKVAAAIDNKTNKVDGLTIKLSTATVEIDGKTLDSIIEQADGKEIKLNVDDTGTTRLNNAQKESIKNLDVLAGVEAYFTCNGKRISDFKGGSVVIRIPFVAPSGYDANGFSVWYVAEDGQTTKYVSKYDEEASEIVFTVNHFSDYIIVYDEADAEKANEQARIDAIANIKLVARSKMTKLNGKKSVRVHWFDQNGVDLEEFGFDGYEVYRSEKRYSGYGDEPFFETDKTFYHNTAIEDGKKYYYKVYAYIIVDGKKYYTEQSLKAWRTVK